MKKSEIILALVGIVLVVAVLLGVFAFTSAVEDIPEYPVNDKEPITDSTGSPGNYAVYENKIGYITNGNVTTFFVLASAPDLVDSESCDDVWTVSFEGKYKYLQDRLFDGTLTNLAKYSIDGGNTWQSFIYDSETSTYNMKDDDYISTKYEIFIAFDEVTNCASIDSYCEEYLDSYFYDKIPAECKCCGGNYNYYSTFKWDAHHKPVQTAGGNGNGAIG